MMEYAQYPPPPHGHNPAHLQGGYPNTNQHSVVGAAITSPPQPMHSQHNVHSQASSLLSSQQQQNDPQAHSLHQQLSYQPQPYGVAHPQMQYGMTPQAAAMAATAAASGQGYQYSMSDAGLQHNSPRMAGLPLKQELGGPSPKQINNQIGHVQARRMSQISNSTVVNAQPIMNHAGPRSVIPPMPTNHQPQSPDFGGAIAEESPLYVNAKQFHRILKRRVARQNLEDALRLTTRGRKPYLHESRHNHAMRRPRGAGGRFLTADEVAEIERAKAGGDHQVNPSSKAIATTGNKAGSKRKAPSNFLTQSKKAKPNHPPRLRSSDEDDDDEDGDGDDEG
ncbi:hypothetical protein K3495_g11954 [Podosphaera aphanis]|nr:hypothetical protein K3495_g11954 [Podosphaera aphanis]